ncbi:hypothetical protein ABW19_dt0205496 [Dactylella cylindrospora]|nr:hypothetical protein ABW19_dt0205496 [Dactylella cylindrospora]
MDKGQLAPYQSPLLINQHGEGLTALFRQTRRGFNSPPLQSKSIIRADTSFGECLRSKHKLTSIRSWLHYFVETHSVNERVSVPVVVREASSRNTVVSYSVTVENSETVPVWRMVTVVGLLLTTVTFGGRTTTVLVIFGGTTVFQTVQVEYLSFLEAIQTTHYQHVFRIESMAWIPQ